MAYIKLSGEINAKVRIMIFTEGTILKPKSLFSLYDYNSYIPIGNCVELIKKWSEQGAEVVYCTSRRNKQAEQMADILCKNNFIGTKLYFRDKGQKYKDIVEMVCPDILIEDNCRSIGGAWQMCITNVSPEIKAHIKSVVVEEFKGIDMLPENISDLMNFFK